MMIHHVTIMMTTFYAFTTTHIQRWKGKQNEDKVTLKLTVNVKTKKETSSGPACMVFLLTFLGCLMALA